jgi:hypothetical protein
MSVFGKKLHTKVTLTPAGASAYDITGETASVVALDTALKALTELAFGCGQTYPLVGTVTMTDEQGDPNPCGKTEKLKKVVFTVTGLETVADNAIRTALVSTNEGKIMNCYIYDWDADDTTAATTKGAGLAVELLGCLVKVRQKVTSLDKELFEVEITSQYHGNTTSRVIPMIYVA